MAITHVKSDNHKLLQEIADCLAKAKKIVAVTGAGISTNCGIPVSNSSNIRQNIN
jgi:accessory colonization factor AcfC